MQLGCVLLGIVGLTAYAISKFTPGRVVVLVTGAALLGFVVTLIALGVRLQRPALIARAVGASLLASVLGTFLILFPLIYVCQDPIANRTSAFFQPQTMTEPEARALTAGGVEAIDLTTPDGARLRGWLLRNSNATHSPLLIFFGGSGSESSAMIPYMRQLSGWSVALVNYRGFGVSTGTPSHAHALADAILLYDTLAQRPDVDRDRIVAMGYSLGTGVAVHLAAERPIAGTVLVAPYDQMTLIGLKQSPLYIPLGGIMKHYFDSVSRASEIQTPLLCLTGAADTAVPLERSLKLAGAWGGEAVLTTYEGEDHDLLLHENRSWSDIAAFLRRIAQK